MLFVQKKMLTLPHKVYFKQKTINAYEKTATFHCGVYRNHQC